MLLMCGDWACAHCNPEGLASVAQQLHDQAGTDEQRLLLEIERLTEIDMLRASDLWSKVTYALRERCFGRDSSHS